MNSTRLSLLTIVLCYFVTKTVQFQNLNKLKKIWSFDDDVNNLKAPVFNPPPPFILSLDEKPNVKSESCQLRKAVFTYNPHYSQYMTYKAKIPSLKEFTLCHWHNIYNYTHDQPIFSYTHHGITRLIYSWIENSPQKTYYSLAINGHTIYRINYPEKLFKWYHVCQSWNGHTGEWQLWINSERVGRGFYNLMVGKLIIGGGVALSGREYLDQAFAVHHSAFSGELTLLTLYKAALTAGKAYNDHKHHHVHNFHHGYDESVDEADTEEPDAPAVGPEPTRPTHLAHGGKFVNGQLLPKLPVAHSAMAMTAGFNDYPTQYEHQLFDGGLYDFYSPLRNGISLQTAQNVDDTFRVNLLDRNDDNHQRKRNATITIWKNKRSKRWTPLVTRNKESSYSPKYEPAEWEVRKVADLCEACENDPFGSASILSWHKTKKQFFNGAEYVPATQKCYSF